MGEKNYFVLSKKIIDDEDLIGNELLIYTVLCRYADKKVDLKTISKKSGLNKKVVQKNIELLAKKNIIKDFEIIY